MPLSPISSSLDSPSKLVEDGARYSPSRTAILVALGVVYGDLGTSPLYTLQTIEHLMGHDFTPEAALGSVSLIFWSLIITISVKYGVFVMRADNHGEGGILALMAMTGAQWSGRARWPVIFGLFGAALIYGDGIITPSISVLSAVEGLNAATPIFEPYTLPIAALILVALFSVQNRGTARVGKVFGPVMLVWFGTLAMLGVGGIMRNPQVLGAVNPIHGLRLLGSHGTLGFSVLSGVFLALTGGEALYADMGNVGRRAIRIAWYSVVLPALVLNYAGQVANFIDAPELGPNPFFKLAPGWAVCPLVGLATIATVIASQAIITGSFSMTRRAMQLGWLPGLRIDQTSAEEYGQIYIPFVNRSMMLFTVALAMSFGDSARLAGAYGMAVSTTMVLTTVLLYEAMRRRWGWTRDLALVVAGPLLAIDLAFFSANLSKISSGGWIPLTLGMFVFAIMTTWRYGVAAVNRCNVRSSLRPAEFFARLRDKKIVRVQGTGLFLTRLRHSVPPLIVNHVERERSLHETVVALSVSFESIPRVPVPDRMRCQYRGQGLWHVTIRFGFVESPDLPSIVSQARRVGIPMRDELTYYVERHDPISRQDRPAVSRWRVALFAFMSRNSAHAVDRFKIPPNALVEVGRRVEL
ncbi:potassium transporter Kup [Bradyrhizobium sp. Pha-3]|uniref:potassium transporter Kup n=1 Tax=Bradyrhizobium sp. Pha-3 TaxID=208375 RepID=UPI0035D5194B